MNRRYFDVEEILRTVEKDVESQSGDVGNGKLNSSGDRK
jgi:hypothetical protein